jgi:hypothetical protein
MTDNKYFEQIRESQFGDKLGGTYIEVHEMLEAIMNWADYNFDDWLDVARNINDVKIGDLKKMLQARIEQNEGYYRIGSGQYARNELVDFINSK